MKYGQFYILILAFHIKANLMGKDHSQNSLIIYVHFFQCENTIRET
jgi:hypothetical protein